MSGYRWILGSISGLGKYTEVTCPYMRIWVDDEKDAFLFCRNQGKEVDVGEDCTWCVKRKDRMGHPIQPQSWIKVVSGSG